ncbi:MAG: hypothetical protein CVV64_11310 [Candidatus Wallbacteria bacterium HGW-Wallbacteria-1]|uniref:Carbamoyltransferase n=1 Tax=Candidatus Wallbacteria bacterium HGW-Wallbacteria-1 TaxID=2013854 RepID=A0A2N1PP40_9BACT|nr:MAG: hypothetical protein CVV64_11310 [Candidatus Wallbacteria bacterium HGW-Wallbacteria-1]
METIISKSSNILGISAFYHDSAACLLRNGDIIAAVQEERFTRNKHDSGLPLHSVAYCLKEGGLKISDCDFIAFYEKPMLKFERLLETYIDAAPHGFRSFAAALPLWLREKLWIPHILREKLNYNGDLIFPEHHESHAASAFYPSPFAESAILTIDGVGEWSTTTWGVGSGNEICIEKEIRFPDSLGLLYAAFTYYLGFKVNSGEYKVMGLAPYGNDNPSSGKCSDNAGNSFVYYSQGASVYVKKIYEYLIDVKSDGSFKLNMCYFDYRFGFTMTNQKFHELFEDPPREAESVLTQKHMDLAKAIQIVSEEIVLRIAFQIHRETKLKNLCLAGGFALNCVANGRILREGPYNNLWIQPAAGDAGGALGSALFAWYKLLGNKRSIVGNADFQKGSYLGPHWTTAEIEVFLQSNKLPYQKFPEPVDFESELPKKIASLIAEGYVIGHFHGRMEYGPRALGNRSIIGDARSSKMQSIMNLKIKFRESFRPFAPSVMVDDVKEWFDIDVESPYMLLVANVASDKCLTMTRDQEMLFGIDKLNIVRSDIPAITHVDYSARLQTVNPRDNKRYYDIIKAFKKLTGCPVIINTSFNVRGEPIVCTPVDAYKCFMRTELDFLVLDRFILSKFEQPIFHDEINWKQEFQLD